MKFYERPDYFDAHNIMYYSKEDYQDMKSANKNAIRYVNQRYLSQSTRHDTAMDDSTDKNAKAQEDEADIACMINGIENVSSK